MCVCVCVCVEGVVKRAPLLEALTTNNNQGMKVTVTSKQEHNDTKVGCSLASHTLRREEGSGHATTIELSPRQKLDVTFSSTLFVDRICCHGVAIMPRV